MKQKSNGSVSVIGGADGPTSIFIAGRTGKKPLKIRVRQFIYQCRRKRMAKKIVVGAHSLEEVISYAKEKYHAVEILKSERNYVEQQKSLKESLIITNKPELLGELQNIPKPERVDEEAMKEWWRQIERRSEMIAQIPDSEMPMDFHIYEMRQADGRIEVAADYIWDIFGVSYSGSKKTMKQLKKIAQDLYVYYGVTNEDIEGKSERYSALLSTLSD